MRKSFTVPKPDELYVDAFEQGNVFEVTYEGPETVYVLVDRQTGMICGKLDTPNDPHNQDFFAVVEVNANVDPAVAYLIVADRRREEPVPHVTITNVDGSTHEEIAEPALFDCYGTALYNFETQSWTLQQVLREKRSPLYYAAETNKKYVVDNMAKFSSNTTLTAIAEAYIDVIEAYQTSGNGSIYSWRMATWNMDEVPQIPPPLVMAAIRG